MLWHIDILIEAILLTVILQRKPKLRWWESLIGVDFVASALQLIPYRVGYRSVPVLIWETGIVLGLPLGALALIEAGEMARCKRQYWHLRILALWLTGRLLCVSLQTQPALVIPVNHALLALDSAAFLAWSVLLLCA